MIYTKEQIETLVKKLLSESNEVFAAKKMGLLIEKNPHLLRDAADALAAQAARIAKLELDAARYRWLRDKANGQGHLLRAPLVLMTNDDCSNEGWRDVLQGTQLDAAIDAVSKSEEK